MKRQTTSMAVNQRFCCDAVRWSASWKHAISNIATNSRNCCVITTRTSISGWPSSSFSAAADAANGDGGTVLITLLHQYPPLTHFYCFVFQCLFRAKKLKSKRFYSTMQSPLTAHMRLSHYFNLHDILWTMQSKNFNSVLLYCLFKHNF